jgi:predicted metal-dependent peptidase
MSKVDIRTTLVRSIVDIAREKEFYGHIIQQFQREHVKSPHPIDTAAVGRPPGGRFIKLYLNDAYFEDLIKTEVELALKNRDDKTPVLTAQANGENQGWKYICGAMEHEIMHVALGHLFLKFDDKRRGNYALDCVVNSYLPPSKLHHTWIHPSRYGLPERKAAMWYYRQLENNEKYQKDAEAEEAGQLGEIISAMAAHSMWDDVKEDDLAEEFVKDIIRKSMDLCRDFSDIDEHFMEQIKGFLKPRPPMIPWTRVTRMFTAKATESILSYTQKRISKRFGTRPGTRKGDVLNLALIVDTSGSMSLKHIGLLMNEVYWIWKNGVKVTVFQCDTHVHKPTKYKGKWDGTVHGRGGTYFDLALDEVEGKYDAAIYFTDGLAPKVKRRYRIPVLFVLTTDLPEEEYPYPWGKTVKIADAIARVA